MQRLAGGRCGGRAPGACRSSHVPVLVAMGCAGCGPPGSRLHTCPRRGRDHRCIRLARGDVSQGARGAEPLVRPLRLRPSPGRAHQPVGRAGVASKAKLAEAAAGMPLLRAHEIKDVEWRALRSEHACEGTRRASRRRDPGMGGVLCSLRRMMTPPIRDEPFFSFTAPGPLETVRTNPGLSLPLRQGKHHGRYLMRTASMRPLNVNGLRS